ncbi:Hypothetical protein R9X50_00551400 [Acrodontium crateriforme]|uniref:non-specific serine/threonine protein kinase n=1 Tax=Acrodontium crateriforme TaxID=150365 RepID=A0AAQ3M793_9PEZI|nr:Hypothetical protein R9X50_00551400 [Acrodontium crateriforme]
MAEDTPPRHMSLIPYPTNSQVVLRRGNAVVLWDEQSHQLSVRNVSDHTLEEGECPFCHRPWNDNHSDGDENEDERRGRSSGPQSPFLHPRYFATLDESRRASASRSGPSTPTRGFFPPPALRSGRSRDVSGSSEPPIGAEFITSQPATSSTEGISKSAFSPGFFKQFFVEKRELGRGGNGVVLLVEHVIDRVSLGHFACKRIPVGNDHNWLEKTLVEVKLLEKVHHSNLVSYRWTWLEDWQSSSFAPSVPCLWILQEYCNGGDLHKYIIGPQEDISRPEYLKKRMRRRSKEEAEPPKDMSCPSKLTFDEIFSFFRDITNGLHCLHSQGYIHRDLKPSNCLIQRDGAKTKVLLSDFGEVREAGTKRGRGSTGATGTISYCAPEVLQRNSEDGMYGDFTTKSDIFSLGMIVYFMCFGRLPYVNADDINEENEDLEELRAEITKWPGFDDESRQRPDLPERLYRYLKRLLSVDPNERPSTEEILSSIGGGATLGEAGFPPSEDTAPRVSVLETPNHRTSPQSRNRGSIFVSRPGLSSVGSQSAGDRLRSRSPLKKRRGSHSQSHSRPTSPMEGSVVIRPRKLVLTHPSDGTKLDSDDSLEHKLSPQQSPRLMLPPPPEPSAIYRLVRQLHQPAAINSLRALIFGLKLLSLSIPCSPLATSSWLLYPLLGVAALDVGILEFDQRQSILLFLAHMVVVAAAYQRGQLCTSKAMLWTEDLH